MKIRFLSVLNRIKSHFARERELSMIRSSGLFDENWYLAKNPDVALANVNPLLHYTQYGGFEGRDPGPNFSSVWYLDTYEDVKKAGINPLVHYLKFGRKEGRLTSSMVTSQVNAGKATKELESITYQDAGNDHGTVSLPSIRQLHFVDPSVPEHLSEEEPVENYAEIKVSNNPEEVHSISSIRLFAIIGTWMEEDIIAATIRNAFTQGCERIYLVDNGSTDDTVKIACENGATMARSYISQRYNELERLSYMNSVMREVSEQETDQSLWWLFLDADEFPHGPSGMTVLSYVRSLDRQFRVVGSRFFDHYPNSKPAYLPGRHPIDFQPLCEEIILPMCSQGHRKHQLLKYDKRSAIIEASVGFHHVRCSEPVSEPVETIFCHHFPFREEVVTYNRLARLWAKDESGMTRANPAVDTHMLARIRSMDAVYHQDWGSVVNFVSLDPISSSLKTAPESTGVNLKSWDEIVPEKDQSVLRWYSMLDAWKYDRMPRFNYGDDRSYIKGIAFLDGHGDIEDWGSGFGYAKTFIKRSNYIGIDGSSPNADKIVDLTSYTSSVDCIFIRHVLEHNTHWAKILANAVSSFRKRMVLILFTPFSTTTHQICMSDRLTAFPVPDISFRREDLAAFFEGLNVSEESLNSETQYGGEHIFYLEKGI